MRRRTQEAPAACNVASKLDATEFESAALEQLRTFGMRITVPRLQVIRTLAHSRRALSAYQIHEAISASGGKIDVVSVYRILDALLEVGLAHRIGVVDGFYACRSQAGAMHDSEHLVCKECGCIIELAMPSEAQCAVSARSRTAGFEVSEIRTEILGTCAHCRPAH